MSTMLSANDLVPEAYQMRLMMWRDEFTRGYFEIGDIANEIVYTNIQRGLEVDQNSIYSAVGKFCGKSGRTIRDYSEVASFFPVSVREEYDVLPFSHFRFAKSCGLRYKEILDHSLENPSISVDALEMRFGSHPITAWPLPSVASETPVASSSAVDTGEYIAFSPPSPQINEVYALANLISQSERLLMWDIHKDIRSELMVALDSLKHVLACLSSGGEVKMKFDYENVDLYIHGQSK